MNEDLVPMDSFERIYICTHKKSKDDEQNILVDFAMLDIVNSVCNDPSDINYNDGLPANAFDKIAKYYGRKNNVFQFISLLKNDEFSKKVMDKIGDKCDAMQLTKFIERATIYLNRIKRGENDAKEFLKDEKFSDAFFNGYHYGEKTNIHENLNINFTEPTQFLDLENIFNLKIDAMITENSFLRRVKVYDNGRRAVTILNDEGKRKYAFTSDSSCQLAIKKKSSSVLLDIIAGNIINVEFEINGVKRNPREVFAVEEIVNNVAVVIGQNCLRDALYNYFNVAEITRYDPYGVQEECLPIKTLEDLFNWKPLRKKHFTEQLRKREESKGPKTLVCHDMKGGYLEDRFINGTDRNDSYFFIHWQLVDIFVYFSHNFVTIPPCSWISAAHKNGVQILGTFITEWDDGSKICDEVFKDERSVNQFIEKLVNIAVYYNFDGWLINIENKLETCQIPLLRKFVSTLTSQMHAFCPGSQIIWYDSVKKNGELDWQNALNDSNRMFFLACDGIFLNYNWSEEHLTQSVAAAGDRITDVYVGVDVFGRGCLGGGGFSTDIAVAAARKFGLSVAIFAPGWVYECLDANEFKENQFKFWGSLQKYCSKRRLLELPYSTFCPGFGKKMYRHGKEISNKPWHNLGLQSLQPIYSPPEKGYVHAKVYDLDAYHGGGCLHLEGFTSPHQYLEYVLLETVAEDKTTYIFSYTFKPLLPSTEIVLVVRIGGLQIHCTGKSLQTVANDGTEIAMAPSTKEEILETGYELKEVVQKDETWITRTYVIKNNRNSDEKSCRISVILEPGPGPVSALLGELDFQKVLSPENDVTVRDLSCESDPAVGKKVKLILEWKQNPSITYTDIYLGSENKKEYIGTTSQFSYKLEHIFPSCHGDYFDVMLFHYSPHIKNIPCVTKHIYM